MAGGEDETQEIVVDVVVGRFEIRCRYLPLDLELAAQLLMLAVLQRFPAQEVDCLVLCRAHEPGARSIRDA